MRLLYIFILSILLSLCLAAQPGNSKVEALRVAFISKQLELSPAESEKFWPVYNEYNDKLKAIKRNLRGAYHKHPEPLSDADAEDLYKLEMQSRSAELEVHKQYGEQLKAIIGAKKMVKLRVAEDEFKRELIKTIKEHNE